MTERSRTAKSPTVSQNTHASWPKLSRPSLGPNTSPAARAGMSSGGHALDRTTQTEMSARFGHDFSSVRVHTDSHAAETAGAFGAHAFAAGSDIVFGEGKYAPGSSDGERLIAHELTHVVQQAQFGQATDPGGLSQRGDSAEREADSLASQVMMGQSVQAQAAPTAAIHFFRPPQAGDQQWADKTHGDEAAAGIRTLQAIPGIGNIFSAVAAGESLGVAGYDAITGDSKGASSSLKTAEDFGLDAIPFFGNVRAGVQATHDWKAVSRDYDGVNPEANHNSVENEGRDVDKINTSAGDLLRGLFDGPNGV